MAQYSVTINNEGAEDGTKIAGVDQNLRKDKPIGRFSDDALFKEER